MNNFNIIEYVVKSGDNLYTISNKYDLTVDELMKYNNLSSNVIYPNQILFIPVNKDGSSTSSYVTSKNDTLEMIANRNNLTCSDLLRFNDICKLVLEPNQLISLSDMRSNKHLVLPTDTIESILNKYNLTIEELVKLNGSNWLVVGETIRVK